MSHRVGSKQHRTKNYKKGRETPMVKVTGPRRGVEDTERVLLSNKLPDGSGLESPSDRLHRILYSNEKLAG